MINRKAIGYITANYSSTYGSVLLKDRPIASVPFLGRYRLIDFPLSNMMNAGIKTVGVVMPGNYRSLIDHVGSGKDWGLDRKKGGLFMVPGNAYGTTKGGMRFLLRDIISNKTLFQRSDKPYVVMMGTNIIFNMDLNTIIEAHENSGAQMTVVYCKATRNVDDETKLQINETELQIVQLNKNFSSDVVKELSDVQAQVFDLQEKATALEDRLSRIVIRAPEDGMVLDMKVHTIGGVVGAGTPLLDIVPKSSELVVDARVSTNDIDRIALGKLTDIRFSAFNSATTPVIQGQVTRVSADRLTDEHSGDPYYLVRVKVTDEGMKHLGDSKLQPGMPAEVLINAGDRTMLQYLMKPARNLFAKSMIEE